MIRGIASVVSSDSLVAGAFYLFPRYGGEPYLMQAVSTAADYEPTYGLFFEPDVEPPLSLSTLETPTPYVLMPNVSIRIDPPSISGHPFSSGLRAGMLIVAEDVPYAVAGLPYRGYSIVDMSTGLMTEGIAAQEWIAFERWQLVVDENGEEVPIASFGTRPSGST